MYRILQARSNKPPELLIYGDIGSNPWADESVSAKSVVESLSSMDSDRLHVRINSYGGSVADGVAIYNALKRHPAHVVTQIDGNAVSIASMIALAGDEVQMAENALMMIHAPWATQVGNADDMRAMADTLDMATEAISGAYRQRLGAVADDLLTDGKDHWFSAQTALNAGLIDTITEKTTVLAALPDRFSNHPARADIQQEEVTMTIETKQPDGVDTSKLASEILAAEHSRRQEIRAAFGSFSSRSDLQPILDACLDDPSVDVGTARARLLAELAKTATPTAHAAPVGTPVASIGQPGTEHRALFVSAGADERDKFQDAATSAMLARVGQGQVDNANPYRGYKLQDMARASLDRVGVNTRGYDSRQIVAAIAQTTSDFPVILENTMNKTLLAAYQTAPDTWRQFCAIGSVGDFRAHNRYRFGSLGNLDSYAEAGEYLNKSIPDGEKASITAGTKGNIIAVTREAIINDDLGALTQMASMLGRAAARTIEHAVYSLLGQNAGLGPTMSDTYTLFHANHNNISSGAALSVASIEASRILMASQLDISGNDYLDIRPSIWLGSMASGGTARVINMSQYDPDTASKLQRPNMVAGLFSTVIDTPRLSGTRFYLFANPSDAPVIEVAFLDGMQAPYIENQQGWRTDGVEYKVRLDFGVAVVDYRGAVTNAGA